MRKFNSLPTLNYANGAMLQMLSNTTHEVLRQLRALDYPVRNYDLFIVHGIHERLDGETSKAWEFFRGSETPTVQELLDFLDRHAKALSNVHSLEQKEASKKRKHEETQPNSEGRRFKAEKPEGETGKRLLPNMCAICNNKHPVHACPSFLKMNQASRKKNVKEHNLCRNCLKPHHISKDCYGGPCSRCDVKHNSLLCPENPANRIVATIQKNETRKKRKGKAKEAPNPPEALDEQRK